MQRHLEKELWERIGLSGEAGTAPREIIKEMLRDGKIASPKEAWATLAKWDREGVYEYGVSLDLGWRLPGKTPRRLQEQNKPQ